MKEIKVTKNSEILQSHVAKPIPRLLGKKYGKNFTAVVEAIKSMTPLETEQIAHGNHVKLEAYDSTIEILPEEIELESVPIEGFSIAEESGLLIGVNIAIDEELSSEGLARDIVRRIQALRKEANFGINDHIKTYYYGDSEITDVFQEEAEYIKMETLSDVLIDDKPPKDAKTDTYEVSSLGLTIGLKKVE